MRNKKGAAGPIMSIVIAGLIIATLVGALWIFAVPKIKQMAVSDGDIGSVTQCDSTTTPQLDPNSYNVYAGTALTEGTNLQRQDGDTIYSTFTQGTAIANLEIDGKYELVFGVDTTDWTDNAYGPRIMTDKIGCIEEVDFADVALFADEEETGLTAVFYNDDGNAAAEVFTTGQSQNIYLKWTAANEEVFGNPYVSDTPNVVCVNLNSSEWEQPIKVSIEEGYAYNVVNGVVQTSSLAGKELKKVSTPLRHAAVASMVAYCYEAPVFGDDGARIKFRLEADGSNAPNTDMTAFAYAGNWFYNADTFSIDSGIENEDGTAVGTDAADELTMDFT